MIEPSKYSQQKLTSKPDRPIHDLPSESHQTNSNKFKISQGRFSKEVWDNCFKQFTILIYNRNKPDSANKVREFFKKFTIRDNIMFYTMHDHRRIIHDLVLANNRTPEYFVRFPRTFINHNNSTKHSLNMFQIHLNFSPPVLLQDLKMPNRFMEEIDPRLARLIK